MPFACFEVNVKPRDLSIPFLYIPYRCASVQGLATLWPSRQSEMYLEDKTRLSEFPKRYISKLE